MNELKAASIFSDCMVLQQGIHLPVWGWGPPGSKITVRFANQEKSGTINAEGKWKICLDPLPVKTDPQILTISTANSSITFQNVLVGEVWIASGQSNMQWSVSQSKGSAETIRDASNWPTIRLFTVDRIAGDEEYQDLDKYSGWHVCAPDKASTFSGVAYAFGRHLSRNLNVPIGLINTSWGGTIAEAWTPMDALEKVPDLHEEIVKPYQQNFPNLEEATRKWENEVAQIKERTRDTGITANAASWMQPDCDDSSWKVMSIPGYWRQEEGMNINGIVWFRKEFSIPHAWSGKALTLSVGACDKSDITWFNGVKVGSLTMEEDPMAWNINRVYTIPSGIVREGRAVIAVRIHSDMHAGGMTGPCDLISIAPEGSGPATALSLSGAWKYQVETSYGLTVVPPQPPGPGTPNRPAVLYNAMIHPLVPYGIRGAIWYQGESNASRAAQYRGLFQTMIRSWRERWQTGNFPFLFVQLANYNADDKQTWPYLRESQTAALDLPNTGMAVIIDIGDANDIHPTNKEDVGKRLALWALDQTYGKPQIYSGPLYQSIQIEGNKVRVHFREKTADGLEIRGSQGKRPSFLIAGKEMKFVDAKASIAGNTLVLSSPEIPAPAAVRYAWWNCPDGPLLFNAAGLPASPFRSDTL